jgi:hypothetical protein
MLDYQRIVDDVRSALLNNGDTGDDFLQAAAADYSLAIDEANERLRQCGAFLRKGLRSEAIQLCEVEPNLLDVVGILDFPERDTWNELLSLHNLSSPSALMLDVGANLNEAYAIEQPLATLLQRHRLLAMSHGPMKLRVETLRSLADADPENPIWDQDLRIFEEERVKELQREVPQAIAGGDAAAVNALAAELEHSAWRIDRPEALISQIAAARANAARAQGVAALQQTADCLNAAYTAFDVDGGRGQRTRWDQLFATWGRCADTTLLQSAAAALDWLREQDDLAAQAARHEQAVNSLEQAIATRRPEEELYRLHREAGREGDIPEEVEKRFHARLDKIRRAGRRRLYATLAVLAAFVAVAGAIVAVNVHQHMQEGKADRALASLQQLVQDENVDQARNFIDQLAAESPQIAADPRIQEINSRLGKRQKDEDGRRRALATAMDLLQKSVADHLPDRDALARAKKLAKSDEENAAIKAAEQEIDKQDRDVKSKVDQDFLTQLKDLKERVDTIEKDIEDKPDASIEKLKDLVIELSNLRAQNPQISEAAAKPADLLRGRLKALDDEAHTVNDRLSREEAITAACGDNAAFQKRLLAYADKFPQARRSSSFRAVAADEPPLWDWVGQWNDAVQTIGRRNSARFNRKAAGELAAKLRKLLDDRPGHPEADAFRQRLPYLESIARRIDGEGNPIEAALKPVFADPLVAGAWMLTDTAGQRYYLLEDPQAKLGSLSELKADRVYGFEYVVGFDLSKKRKSLRGNDFTGGAAIAPQRRTSRDLTTTLGSTTDDGWEPSFCRMIETVVSDKNTDPLLKHFLLRKVVAVGCQGSLCLQKGFGRFAETLKDSKVPATVNWVDPDNSEATEQRPLAEAELGRLPSFADAQAATAKEWRSLSAAIGTELTCVGWLRKNMAGNWQCLTKVGCPESGRLLIVRIAEANGQKQKAAVFEAIGRLEHGKAAVEAASGTALAEGRPVYVVGPPPK